MEAVPDDGIYVSVGISSDTTQFAVATIRNWWKLMGAERYPAAKKLLITADGGGSNGSRNRLWKTELQNLANEGIKITDNDLAALHIIGDEFHPNWNYTVLPLNV